MKAAYIVVHGIVPGNLYAVRGILKDALGEVFYLRWKASNAHHWVQLGIESGVVASVIDPVSKPRGEVVAAEAVLMGSDVQKVLDALGEHAKASGFSYLPLDPDELEAWQEESAKSKDLLEMVIPTAKMNAFGKHVGQHLLEPRRLKEAVGVLENAAPVGMIRRYGYKPLEVMFNREWLTTEGRRLLRDHFRKKR